MTWIKGLSPAVRDILVLVALGAGLWLTSCGMWDLRGPDEGRYTQIAKELLTRHNWFYLSVNGAPYDQKPPLAFWLFAGMLKLTGGDVASWALRLPAVLAAIATVIMTYFLGRDSFGRRSGFFAALMLMTSPLFMENAPTVELNMLFTAFITGSLCAWITRPLDSGPVSAARCLVFWGCLAAAFFVKGPLAIIIVLSVVGWEAWSRRSWSVARSIYPVFGIVGLGVLIGGWLYLQGLIHGADFVKGQVAGETYKRVLDGAHSEPFWYYLPRIFSSVLFPWVWLVFPAVAMAFMKPRGRREIGFAARPYFAWIGFPFVLLCFAQGKRQAYLLPLLPAATVLLGAFFDRSFADKRLPVSVRRVGAGGVGAVGLLMAGAGAFAAMYPERVRNDVVWVSAAGMTLLIVCGLAILYIGWRILRASRYWKDFLYGGVALIMVGAWANFMVVRPAFDPSKSTRYLSNALDLELTQGGGGREPEGGVVGAIGGASKAEYHVYGHYALRTFEIAEALGLTSQTVGGVLPNLVVLKNDGERFEKIAASLIQAGYTQRRSLVISKDDLMLFRKPVSSGGDTQSKPMNFLLAGDTGSGKPQIYNIVREMTKRHLANAVDGIFLLGDNLYDGHSVARSLQTLFTEPFAPLLSRNIPFYAALGNHDYHSGRARGEVEFAPFKMVGRRYYSLDYGVGQDSVSFFVCDSESLKSGDEAQLQWLTSAVGTSNSVWKILLLHTPLEATEFHHGPSGQLRHLLQPVMGEVDVVFSGHNHIYERREIVDGTLHVTSGSGGQLTTGTMTPDKGRAVGYNKLGSFVQMEINGGAMALTVRNENGHTVDHVILRSDADGSGFEIEDGRGG